VNTETSIKRIKPPRYRHPVFVAHTPFYRQHDLPANLGLDGSPYSADGLRVSESDYWEKYYEVSDYHYEWNNGVLEEKPVSDYATFTLYKWLFLLVETYLLSHPIARLVALETGFRMQLERDKGHKKTNGKTGDKAEEKVTIRKPDFFVVRNDNPTPYPDSDNSFHGIADLCVEAVSDTSKKNLERDTKTKRVEYELAGVREFYMLDADGRYTAFFRRNSAGKYEEIPVAVDGIIRSEVLPGFQFRIADLYRRPNLLELSDDDVYRHFVLPEFNQAKAQAAQERTRAEQERTRAEQEHARAERLAAQLRSLGIAEE
jgi:Uma2 family endonuclease